MAGAELLWVGVAVTAVAVLGIAAVRLGQSVIPAYMAVGIGLQAVADALGLGPALVEWDLMLSLTVELGIVLLLFFLGLEFRLETLLAKRDRLVAMGGVDFLVNFGLGLALGLVLGYTVIESLFVAGIVYMSSSAIVTKSLIDLGWIADPESEAILGTMVFEDLLIAVYLAVLFAVAAGEGGPAAAAVDVGVALAVLLALFLAARYGTAVLERLFDRSSDELFVLSVFGATALVAGAALVAGVSEAVAAFFVGTALGSTEHLERVERSLAEIRDLFAAGFFFVIGFQTDLGAVGGVLGILAVAVVVSVGGKLCSGTVGGRIYGLDARRSLRVGVGMVPRGEFSLVLAAVATSVGTGALATEIPAFAVGYVLVMSVVGTTLMRYSDPIVARLAPVLEARWE